MYIDLIIYNYLSMGFVLEEILPALRDFVMILFLVLIKQALLVCLFRYIKFISFLQFGFTAICVPTHLKFA